jgi:hypothetical protein
MLPRLLATLSAPPIDAVASLNDPAVAANNGLIVYDLTVYRIAPA